MIIFIYIQVETEQLLRLTGDSLPALMMAGNTMIGGALMATKMIQPWQRSRIYGLAKAMGLSYKSDDKSDDLHLLIESRTGKTSLTQLTFDEGNSIIGELNHRQRFGATAPPVKFDFVETPGGMSKGQYNKVIALICELRKFDSPPSKASIEQRVAGIIKKYMHMTVASDKPYSWLSNKQSIKLIHIIQGILDDARKKAAKEAVE